MIYTPKTDKIQAFQYGRDSVPQWLKDLAKLEPKKSIVRPYLLVTPTPDTNLTGKVCVYTGEYIVKQFNGLCFYQNESQFLYLLFDKCSEE